MIKDDINLIPRKKKIPASAVALVFFITIAIGAIAAIGIYLPGYALAQKEKELQSLKTELLTYEDVELNYIQKMNEFSSLKTRKQNYDDFTSSKNQVLEIWKLVERIKPDDVVITEQIYNEDNTVLAGFAKNDYAIASFEIKLRKEDYFSEIYLESVTGTDEQRSFQITLIHAAEQANGGGQE